MAKTERLKRPQCGHLTDPQLMGSYPLSHANIFAKGQLQSGDGIEH